MVTASGWRLLRAGGAVVSAPAKRALNRMAYSERRIVGYTRDEMFDVVSRVEDYHLFVPWCRRSTVVKQKPNALLCELEVGFPPLIERYTSRVTHIRPAVVRSVAADRQSGLFVALDTTWKFSESKEEGEEKAPEGTSWIHFDLEFEFRNEIHRRMAHLFFDRVVDRNVNAFLDRARTVYGEPKCPPSKAEVLKHES